MAPENNVIPIPGVMHPYDAEERSPDRPTSIFKVLISIPCP